MNRDEVATRWAAVWQGDGSSDLYRDDVLYWPVELPPIASGLGPAAVDDYVRRFHSHVSEVSVDAYRFFGTGSEMVIEAIISGVDDADGGTRKGTGVCAIIDLDDGGRVTREHLHMQWGGRRSDDGDLRPRIPEQDGVERGPAFWHDFAHRQLQPWGSPDADPDGMVDAVYDEDDYVLDSMIGKQPMRLLGREALRSAEHLLLEHLPYRETFISRIVRGGNAAAVWHPVLGRTAASAPVAAFSSLMVLTVNERGKCISEHTYLPAAWPATPSSG